MTINYTPFLVCDRCGAAASVPNSTAPDSAAIREYGKKLGWKYVKPPDRYHQPRDLCADCALWG